MYSLVHRSTVIRSYLLKLPSILQDTWKHKYKVSADGNYIPRAYKITSALFIPRFDIVTNDKARYNDNLYGTNL